MKPNNILKSIKVKICYNKDLKMITHRDFEDAVVSEGLVFVNFLNFIFTSYPDIINKFPPGTLGFTLNGKVPKVDDVLKDGDILEFTTA